MYYRIGCLFLISVFLAIPSLASEIDGVYKTLNPEQGRLNQPIQQIRLSTDQTASPKTIRKIRCYPGCAAETYLHLTEASDLSGSDIYLSPVGDYLIRYADQIWINVIPNSELGNNRVWEYFMFINVYTRPESPKEIDQKKAAEFAITISKQLVEKKYTPSELNTTYYMLTPVYQQKKYQMQMSVQLKDNLMTLTLCDSCQKKHYQLAKKKSQVLQIPIYENEKGNIIVALDKGFIWAELNEKPGKEEWQIEWFFNIYSKDSELIKTLRTDNNKLAEIDRFLQKLSRHLIDGSVPETIISPDFMMLERIHFN
ncbi:hypothetical protein [Teredinibacter sp. KSP-S5-2]|uniref:hypothetical protein n=1 Tax=Teredinibacter sp. KSP-S5-2 TaxID=3034506 RepID=UPI0029343AFE|nr:hypothetical protein [Teredinibacter sp. KSP-S5-2]WNO09202.1 hypothetical protein P5V12_19865 [Teredinibacter sp. KSP-S5-2]